MRRLIAILGPSFCGSTYTGFVLGSLPGCAHVGESHWLRDRPEIGCTSCGSAGKKCDLITDEFIRTMPVRGWFAELAKRYDSETIISGDKNVENYTDEMLDGIEVVPLILFKNPLSQAASFKRHYRILNRSGREIGQSVNNTLDWMYDRYRRSFGLCNRLNVGIKCFDFDYFLAHKKGVLKALCKMLDLGYDPKAIEFWNFDHHSIGGNDTPYKQQHRKVLNPPDLPDLVQSQRWGAFDRQASIDLRWQSVLSEQDIVDVFKHRYTQELYPKMAKVFIRQLQKTMVAK